MALPESGRLTLQDIVAEFEGPDTFSSYYRGGEHVPDTPTNSNIPESGIMKISDFYGASAGSGAEQGYLFSWGNASPVLGLGASNSFNQRTATKIDIDSDWVELFPKPYSGALARKSDGTYYSWGVNSNSNQLGFGDLTDKQVPTPIVLPGEVVDWRGDVALGSLMATTGRMYAAGNNQSGRFGTGSSTGNFPTYTEIPPLIHEIVRVWMTPINGAAYFLTSAGLLYGAGSGSNGQLGQGNTSAQTNWTLIGSFANWRDFTHRLATIRNICYAIRSDGTLWTWGRNYANSGNNTSPVQEGTDTDWLDFPCPVQDSSSLFIRKEDGSIWARGINSQGQLGVGTTSTVSTFTEVSIPGPVKHMTGGSGVTYMILENGTLWAAGDISQMGLGVVTGNYTTFTQLGSDSDWLSIQAGSTTCLALKKTEPGGGGGDTIGPIAIDSPGTGASSFANISINVSSDYDDQLILAFVLTQSDALSYGASGWTEIYSSTRLGCSMKVYSRIKDSGWSSTTFVRGDGPIPMAAFVRLEAFTNVDLTDPIVSVTNVSTTSSNDVYSIGNLSNTEEGNALVPFTAMGSLAGTVLDMGYGATTPAPTKTPALRGYTGASYGMLIGAFTDDYGTYTPLDTISDVRFTSTLGDQDWAGAVIELRNKGS